MTLHIISVTRPQGIHKLSHKKDFIIKIAVTHWQTLLPIAGVLASKAAVVE